MIIKSHNLEVYTLTDAAHEVGLVTIDPEIGYFSALSSAGDYTYRWGLESFREIGFKRFLLGLGRTHFFRKTLGESRFHFDGEETRRAMLKAVLSSYRQWIVDAETAKVAHLDIKDRRFSSRTQAEIVMMAWPNIFNHDNFIKATEDPKCQRFWMSIWIPFTHKLEAELDGGTDTLLAQPALA